MRYFPFVFSVFSVIFLLYVVLVLPEKEKHQKWVDACKQKQGTPIEYNGKRMCGKIEIIEIKLD